MKQIISTLLFVGTVSMLSAQTDAPRKSHVETSVQLDGVYTSFQDAKFSNIRYNGFGTGIEFSRTRSMKLNEFNYGFRFNYSSSRPSTFRANDIVPGFGTANEFHPTLFFRYSRKLNDKFYVGGRLDLLDIYFRSVKGLGNNKIYYNNGFNLYATGKYRHTINDNWKLEAGVELGLFSFMRESTSFSFSTPQTVIDNGLFNYQDNAVSSPFGLKYGRALPIWKFGNIRIITQMKFKKRWTFAYEWNIRRFSTVKGYPTTLGIHTIGVKFDFIDKEKIKKTKAQRKADKNAKKQKKS